VTWRSQSSSANARFARPTKVDSGAWPALQRGSRFSELNRQRRYRISTKLDPGVQNKNIAFLSSDGIRTYASPQYPIFRAIWVFWRLFFRHRISGAGGSRSLRGADRFRSAIWKDQITWTFAAPFSGGRQGFFEANEEERTTHLLAIRPSTMGTGEIGEREGAADWGYAECTRTAPTSARIAPCPP